MGKRRKRVSRSIPAKGRLREIADKLWAAAVRDDWAGKCAVCGRTEGQLESHHIIPRGHEQTRYNLANGILLCRQHHMWDANMAPHENAAGWMDWLQDNHPQLHKWYVEDPRPTFDGIVNWMYLGDVITEFQEYVDEEEYTKVVGIRFSRWLQEEYGG